MRWRMRCWLGRWAAAEGGCGVGVYAKFAEYVGYVCGRGGVGVGCGGVHHEEDAERDACGSGDEAKAPLDAGGVELRGIAAKGTAVERMAAEVQPAGWIGRWCSIQGWKSQALDSRAVILETWKWAQRH